MLVHMSLAIKPRCNSTSEVKSWCHRGTAIVIRFGRLAPGGQPGGSRKLFRFVSLSRTVGRCLGPFSRAGALLRTVIS